MNFLDWLNPPRDAADAQRVLFGGCPFPARDTTLGVLFTGTPGAGKTELKNELCDPVLRAIASRVPGSPWRRAFLYAHKPRQVLRHLQHLGIPSEQIAVFHPGRIDCRPLEVSVDYAGDDGVWDFAKQFSPDDPRSSEPFWNRAVALEVDGLANTFAHLARGEWYEHDVLWAASDSQRKRWVLEQYEPNRRILESLYDADNARLRSSVAFTLETHAKSLRVASKQLQAARKRGNRPFSFVRDWMQDEDKWMEGEGVPIVVVCHEPSYAKSWGATFVPLLLSSAIRAFTEHSEHTPLSPALTLFDLDEFAQLRMPEYEAREFFPVCRELGGVPVVAVQSEPLLFAMHGEDLGRSILANLSFVAHGASNDPQTAASASAQFGQHELERGPDEGQVFQEPRVPPAELLRENDPGTFRFYCRAPRVGKWRYDIELEDIIRRNPPLTPDDLEEERRMRAPAAEFEPWDEADLTRLGLKLPNAGGKPWPPFLDPDANWREP